MSMIELDGVRQASLKNLQNFKSLNITASFLLLVLVTKGEKVGIKMWKIKEIDAIFPEGHIAYPQTFWANFLQTR